MTDDEIKKYIDIAIKRTISEYKKSGILKESDGAAYSHLRPPGTALGPALYGS